MISISRLFFRPTVPLNMEHALHKERQFFVHWSEKSLTAACCLWWDYVEERRPEVLA